MKSVLKRWQISIVSAAAFAALLFAGPAFAQSVTATPNPAQSGSEGSVQITTSGFTGGGSYAILYDTAGAAIGSQGLNSTSTQSWSTYGWPTGLQGGTFTILAYEKDAGSNATCAAGATLTACKAALASSSLAYATYQETVQFCTLTIYQPGFGECILSYAIAGVKNNFISILPYIFGVVIVVTVLFWAWRKLHGLAKGK